MRRHVAVTALCAFLVVACNGENKPIPDIGPARALPPNNGMESLKGALPKPIGEITAGEFKTVIIGIGSWIGGTHTRRCTDAFLCGFGRSKVDVSIQPTFDAANARFSNLGDKGTILLQMTNNEDKDTGGLGRYKLEAHKTYYVVVKRQSPKEGRWLLVPFDTAKSDMPVASDSGSFHSCDHEPATASEAAFYTCRGSEGHGHGAGTTSRPKTSALGDFGMIVALMHASAFAQEFLLQSPGWVSCAFGCCTLEPF